MESKAKWKVFVLKGYRTLENIFSHSVQQIGNFKIHLCDWNSDTSTEHVSCMPEKASHDFNFKSISLKDTSNDTNGNKLN